MQCRVFFNGEKWSIELDREGVEFLWDVINGGPSEQEAMSDHFMDKWEADYQKVIEPILRITEAYTI